jgi:integrase
MISNLYQYTISTDLITNTKVKSFIFNYKRLFLPYEFEVRSKKRLNMTPYLEDISSNFPVESNVNQMIPVEYYSHDKIILGNFFMPAENKFLFNIVKDFLENFNQQHSFKLSIHHRIMTTSFEDSLYGFKMERIEDFNERTFKKQLLFFNRKIEGYNPFGRCEAYPFLSMFYRYIDDIYLKENGERLFKSFSFNKDLFTHILYQKSLEEDYEVVNINEIGKYPKCDKWFVVADLNKTGTHLGNMNNSFMNFEKIINTELREDLKKYIWQSDLTYRGNRNHYHVLIDFLNQAEKYYQDEFNVINLRSYSKEHNDLLGSNEIKLFSNKFLIYYHASLISSEKYNDKTTKSRISIIRNYLNHIQKKYAISVLSIEQFNTIKIEDNGGIPIPLNDFKEIQKEFTDSVKTKKDEILLIVLQLAIETKLRYGEILGLERDCIASIDDSGDFGTIKYYSKTSARRYKTEVFLMEHIRLIEKALNLTQSINEKSESPLRKYIFIGNHSYIERKVIKLKSRFIGVFKKVCENLYKQGKIRMQYSPNNLRHSYIDSAWQMVEDGLISTLEVGVITGNTASVAAKHYRARESTKRYVEALYEVSILDDEIQGSIVDDKSIQNLPPVQSSAGNCASESCIKVDLDEDSFYKCMTCKKFVTTVNHRSHFENKMEEYKNKKKNAGSIVERNFYTGLIELYGNYLVEIYSLMEGEESGH